MAQTVKFPGVSKQTPADVMHKKLDVEKAGVIAGFLIGMMVGLGPVRDVMNAIDASSLVSGIAIVLTVAAITRTGLVVGFKLASRIGVRR